MPIQSPSLLKENDKVVIIATSKKFTGDITPAVKLLESWGLQVVLGDNLFKAYNLFAGTDEERAADFQKALNDKEIKAILCVRGGYGASRIIDQIDFEKFLKNPKWIVGYSDVTVLHAHVHTLKVQSIHGTMPMLFERDSPESLESLRNALFLGKNSYTINSHPLNRLGKSKAAVVGGNLSILSTITATKSDLDTKGKILFIEEIDEYLYEVDRMMVHLKRAGKLKKLAGLIVGHMTGIKDGEVPFGKTAYEIIADAVKEYDFPVCFGFPAGHEKENYSLVLGKKHTLQVTTDKVIIS